MVYVGVIHPYHCAVTILFLRAKKNVLCEKPLAMNAAQVREMIQAAQDNDVFLMEVGGSAGTKQGAIRLAQCDAVEQVGLGDVDPSAAFAMDRLWGLGKTKLSLLQFLTCNTEIMLPYLFKEGDKMMHSEPDSASSSPLSFLPFPLLLCLFSAIPCTGCRIQKP